MISTVCHVVTAICGSILGALVIDRVFQQRLA